MGKKKNVFLLLLFHVLGLDIHAVITEKKYVLKGVYYYYYKFFCRLNSRFTLVETEINDSSTVQSGLTNRHWRSP